MYNHIKRCIVISAKLHKKSLIQSIHDFTAISDLNYCVNIPRFSNNTISKRFCSQIAINEENNPNNENCDSMQQKLDTFLSNPDNKKVFQILELELDVMRHNAERVPANLRAKEWLELLKLPSRSQRKKYLIYLWRNEKSSENRKAKKELKRNEWLTQKIEKNEEEDTGEIKYGLSYNTMFLRIYNSTINHFYKSKLMQAILYEPRIVFDCGYENYMTPLENHNCAKQLTLAFASNRIHTNPLCLYFCNLDKTGTLMQNFQRNMPNIVEDDFPAYITSESYLDLFPKDKLLYLTPHCRTDLVEYDSDTIYIIGAMVDKSNPQPLSLAKAKKEGIRMAKFPMDKYLDWGSSSTKNLTLDQVTNILLDLRHTRDWKKAFKHVPVRKLKEFRDYALQKKLSKSVNVNRSDISLSEQLTHKAPSIPQDFTFANRTKH